MNGEAEVPRNARSVDWLKAESVAASGVLFRAMHQWDEEAVLDGLAEVTMTAYLLGRRLGIPFARLDLRMEGKLQASIAQQHQLETWHGDLSALRRHLLGRDAYDPSEGAAGDA